MLCIRVQYCITMYIVVWWSNMWYSGVQCSVVEYKNLMRNCMVWVCTCTVLCGEVQCCIVVHIFVWYNVVWLLIGHNVVIDYCIV